MLRDRGLPWQGAPQESAMITDMHRLERAARLAMGDFETALKAAPPPRRLHLPPRFAVPLIILAMLSLAAILFS